jgi:hypothetical protein
MPRPQPTDSDSCDAEVVSDDHVLAVDEAELRLLHEITQEYAAGLAADEAPDSAFQRAQRLTQRLAELLTPPAPNPEPAAAALVWHRPMLGLMTDQGAWQPEVQLLNQSDQRLELTGPLMATGRLRRADGTPIVSRQQQWAMPAVARIHHLDPGQTAPIRVAVMLLEDEIAALEPGFYRLTDVRWGDLEAPEKDVRVD